jgi:hypothetical protein
LGVSQGFVDLIDQISLKRPHLSVSEVPLQIIL